jgi:hypothetical protein
MGRAGDAPEVPRSIARRVERICSKLPETTCRVDRWAYSFEIRRRPFCHLIAPDDGCGRAVPMLVVRPDPAEREALVAIGHPYFASRSGPDRIGVILSAATDWEEMRELITESYRIVAPKKLAAGL